MGAYWSGSGLGKLPTTGHFLLPSPTQAQSLCLKASALTLVPRAIPASEEAGTGNCDYEVFQAPVASATRADRPLQEAGGCGVWLESHGWESETGRENCLGFERPHRALRPPPACSPAPERHPPSPRNYAPCSSDSSVTHEPEPSLRTKKGQKKPKQVVNFSSPSRGEVFSL